MDSVSMLTVISPGGISLIEEYVPSGWMLNG
jgi:hypothetical protein